MISIGRKLSNIYNELCAPICREYGVNQTCFDILLFCANNPQNNTARDICSIRGIKSGIASVAVETLIKDGYMKRECDQNDRRIRRLVPTEKADPIISEGRILQIKFSEALRCGITPEELQSFERMINKLEKNIISIEKTEDAHD